jgi:hypothetical protein
MRIALLSFMLCRLSLATTLPGQCQPIDFQPERCKVFFSIVWQDAKAATSVAGRPEDGTWLPKDAAKKYPELCYSPTATDLRFVVRFNSHYTDQGSRTEAAPVTGTITDRDQNRSTLTGTVNTTVPYSASYDFSILSIETKNPSGDWKDLCNFGRESGCHMSYGNCIANRDTIRPLFKDALKWLHRGQR